MYREWTISELQKVERLYPLFRASDVAHRLGRTPDAVRVRAHLLGVRKWYCRKWSAEELKILDQHHVDGMEALAAQLPGRSRGAIRVMLNARGHTIRGWTAAELALLREQYPKRGADCVDVLPRRSRKAVRLAARRLGIRYQRTLGDGTNTLPWTAEEIQRLRDNDHLRLGELAALFPTRTKTAVEAARDRLRHGRRS